MACNRNSIYLSCSIFVKENIQKKNQHSNVTSFIGYIHNAVIKFLMFFFFEHGYSWTNYGHYSWAISRIYTGQWCIQTSKCLFYILFFFWKKIQDDYLSTLTCTCCLLVTFTHAGYWFIWRFMSILLVKLLKSKNHQIVIPMSIYCNTM